ncbi:hypothetical protein M0813_28286 [Anaeramoeba flamelloides]|uniref:DUF445 domain-containing protein n=1 Tax=Anaeramoeba flamelloides TaxID=1746091 RepID=A0ABQ8XUH6_9EUKA|nr:hypothetical protein M0813_28286 [Anaeramoeba flamelloides]
MRKNLLDPFREDLLSEGEESDEEEKTFFQKHIQSRFNKGFLSTAASLLIMILGIILTEMPRRRFKGDFEKTNTYRVGDYFLAIGIFGFAGGFTNWIAVKMLFDKIPFIYGSGVILRKYVELRRIIKSAVLMNFFDKVHLSGYLENKVSKLLKKLKVDTELKEILESPIVDKLIDQKIEQLETKTEFEMLKMMGIETGNLKSIIVVFILEFASNLGPIFKSLTQTNTFNVEKIRNEIDTLMEDRLKDLTPQIMRKLMIDMLRSHLNWLIFWGNVFGAVIGLLFHLFKLSSGTFF